MRPINLGLLLITSIGLLFSLSARAELPPLYPTSELRPLTKEIDPRPGQIPQTTFFGNDVAVLGNVAMVGMPGAFDLEGRVGIFLRNASGAWLRSGTLKASDRKTLAQFGSHTAMVNRRALIASEKAVYAFQLISGAWKQTHKLTFNGAAQISDLDWQGDLAVIGVQSDSTSDAAYVYDTSSNGMRRIARLVGHDSRASDQFAARVAVYGQDVVATAPGYGAEQGAAYTFSCTTSQCRERQKLIAIDGERGDRFGTAVDIDQNLLVVGAANANEQIGDASEEPSTSNYRAGGAGYVFARSSGTWSEFQTLRPTPTQHYWYWSLGSDVAISGTRILISAPYGIDSWDDGLVFSYRRSSGSTFVANGVMAYLSSQGTSLSIHGTTSIIGAPDVDWWTGSAAIYPVP
jgi:hypothetical protein